MDAQAREIVQRVLREFAAFKIQKPGLRISLEVGDHGAVLHAPAAGEEARADFLAAARVLRRDLLHCLYKRGPVNMEVGEAEDVPASRRPLMEEPPPMPRRAAPERPEVGAPTTDETVGASPEEATAAAPTVAVPHLKVVDLVNEKEAAPRKGWRRVNGREVFEIPEPEERVVVLQACASRTKAEARKKEETEEEMKKRIWF